MSQAASASGRDASVWADTLMLCRRAVEKSEVLEADRDTRERRHRLVEELEAAERAARRKADEYTAEEKSRAKSGPVGNP